MASGVPTRASAAAAASRSAAVRRVAASPLPISSINFAETKAYVRKVMNSYERYQEIYGKSGPAGGLRIEP